LNAAFSCGLFIAAFTAGFVSDMVGRRWTIIAGSTICMAGIFVQGFADSIIMIFGGKFLSSLGFGLGHALAPVYVAEIAPDAIRGICLTLVVGGSVLICLVEQQSNSVSRTV
jgi:MFS transporter, SP family, general alpha glucoside:H+ symporter